MNIVKCKAGHSIHIVLKADVDPATPVGYLFGHSSGIDIFVGHMTERQVKLALDVPKYFAVIHRTQFG